MNFDEWSSKIFTYFFNENTKGKKIFLFPADGYVLKKIAYDSLNNGNEQQNISDSFTKTDLDDKPIADFIYACFEYLSKNNNDGIKGILDYFCDKLNKPNTSQDLIEKSVAVLFFMVLVWQYEPDGESNSNDYYTRFKPTLCWASQRLDLPIDETAMDELVPNGSLTNIRCFVKSIANILEKDNWDLANEKTWEYAHIGYLLTHVIFPAENMKEAYNIFAKKECTIGKLPSDNVFGELKGKTDVKIDDNSVFYDLFYNWNGLSEEVLKDKFRWVPLANGEIGLYSQIRSERSDKIERVEYKTDNSDELQSKSGKPIILPANTTEIFFIVKKNDQAERQQQRIPKKPPTVDINGKPFTFWRKRNNCSNYFSPQQNGINGSFQVVGDKCPDLYIKLEEEVYEKLDKTVESNGKITNFKFNMGDITKYNSFPVVVKQEGSDDIEIGLIGGSNLIISATYSDYKYKNDVYCLDWPAKDQFEDEDFYIYCSDKDNADEWKCKCDNKNVSIIGEDKTNNKGSCKLKVPHEVVNKNTITLKKGFFSQKFIFIDSTKFEKCQESDVKALLEEGSQVYQCGDLKFVKKSQETVWAYFYTKKEKYCELKEIKEFDSIGELRNFRLAIWKPENTEVICSCAGVDKSYNNVESESLSINIADFISEEYLQTNAFESADIELQIGTERINIGKVTLKPDSIAIYRKKDDRIYVYRPQRSDIELQYTTDIWNNDYDLSEAPYNKVENIEIPEDSEFDITETVNKVLDDTQKTNKESGLRFYVWASGRKPRCLEIKETGNIYINSKDWNVFFSRYSCKSDFMKLYYPAIYDAVNKPPTPESEDSAFLLYQLEGKNAGDNDIFEKFKCDYRDIIDNIIRRGDLRRLNIFLKFFEQPFEDTGLKLVGLYKEERIDDRRRENRVTFFDIQSKEDYIIAPNFRRKATRNQWVYYSLKIDNLPSAIWTYPTEYTPVLICRAENSEDEKRFPATIMMDDETEFHKFIPRILDTDTASGNFNNTMESAFSKAGWQAGQESDFSFSHEIMECVEQHYDLIKSIAQAYSFPTAHIIEFFKNEKEMRKAMIFAAAAIRLFDETAWGKKPRIVYGWWVCPCENWTSEESKMDYLYERLDEACKAKTDFEAFKGNIETIKNSIIPKIYKEIKDHTQKTSDNKLLKMFLNDLVVMEFFLTWTRRNIIIEKVIERENKKSQARI